MFRFISFLIFTLFLFSCKQKTELLQAELKSFMMKVDFKLYSDSTYTMERIYEIDSAKNETLTGKFQLIKDTIICSGDFNFKGYLKNNFIESNNEYEKFEIIKLILKNFQHIPFSHIINLKNIIILKKMQFLMN